MLRIVPKSTPHLSNAPISAPTFPESPQLAALRATLAKEDIPIAHLTHTGEVLVRSAIEIRPSKGAEAVLAWIVDHASAVRHVDLAGTVYPRTLDLKEAVVAAGEELDEVARGMPAVLSAIHTAAQRGETLDLRSQTMNVADAFGWVPPARVSFLEFVETRPWWQIALASIAAVGIGYLSYQGLRR